jgi:hypothetical protein
MKRNVNTSKDRKSVSSRLGKLRVKKELSIKTN